MTTESEDFSDIPESTSGIPDGYGFEITSEYRVIRAEKASDSAKIAAAALKEGLDAFLGGEYEIGDDWAKSGSDIPADADACEIVVGLTNRPASVSAFDALGGAMKYSVTIVGKRIIIAAQKDALLSYAVDHFLNNILYADVVGGRLLLPDTLSYTSAEYTTLTIASGGKAQYGMVYSQYATDLVKAEYVQLQTGINDILGSKSQMIKNDALSKAGKYNSAALEILLGSTGHPENPKGRAEFDYNECGFCVVGNKIIVTGRTLPATFYAAERFLELLESSVQKDESGKVEILLPYAEPVKWIYKDYCDGFPEYDGVLTEAYDCGEDTVALYYADAKKGDLEAYVSQAEAEGYVKTASHTAGTESFATLESKSDKVRLYLSEGTDGFRITAESSQTITFPETAQRDNYTTDITFTQMALNYAATGGSTNGMSYALQLDDGSYVIWDGGWAGDAHELYLYLQQHAPSGSIPHVRMWIFTHLHGDHSNCFLEFAKEYSGGVKLDYVGVNIPTIYSDPEGESIFTTGKLTSAVEKFKNAALVKLHTGMVLKMPGADIEVLLTHEDLGVMNIFSDYRNDQSVVTRIIVKDNKVMLPGDAQTTAGEYIVGRYGNYLKSNYVQVAHHGSINHPTTLEFYKVCAPSFVFFPGAQSRFNENKKTEQNAYLVNLVGIKNIYVADGADKTVKLN